MVSVTGQEVLMTIACAKAVLRLVVWSVFMFESVGEAALEGRRGMRRRTSRRNSALDFSSTLSGCPISAVQAKDLVHWLHSRPRPLVPRYAVKVSNAVWRKASGQSFHRKGHCRTEQRLGTG